MAWHGRQAGLSDAPRPTSTRGVSFRADAATVQYGCAHGSLLGQPVSALARRAPRGEVKRAVGVSQLARGWLVKITVYLQIVSQFVSVSCDRSHHTYWVCLFKEEILRVFALHGRRGAQR